MKEPRAPAKGGLGVPLRQNGVRIPVLPFAPVPLEMVLDFLAAPQQVETVPRTPPVWGGGRLHATACAGASPIVGYEKVEANILM